MPITISSIHNAGRGEAKLLGKLLGYENLPIILNLRDNWHINHWVLFLIFSLFEFFHNSCLIRWILQNKIYKKLQIWPGIEPRLLAYLSGTLTITLECFLFLCEVVILFMHSWLCPIHLIHLIGGKSLHFEKTRLWSPCSELALDKKEIMSFFVYRMEFSNTRQICSWKSDQNCTQNSAKVTFSSVQTVQLFPVRSLLDLEEN